MKSSEIYPQILAGELHPFSVGESFRSSLVGVTNKALKLPVTDR